MRIEKYPFTRTKYNSKLALIERKVIRDALFYETLSLELKEEKSIAAKAIINYPNLFRVLPISLKKDMEFLNKIVEKNYLIFFELEKKERWNNDILESFLIKAPYMLNKEVIYGNFFINTIGTEYFNDKKRIIYLTSLLVNINSGFINDRLSKDIFSLIPEDFKNDEKFIKKLIEINYLFFPLIKPCFQDEPDILLELMKKTRGKIFSYFHPEFRSDPFFVGVMNDIAKVKKSDLAGEALNLVEDGLYIENFIKMVKYQMLLVKIPEKTNKAKIKI